MFTLLYIIWLTVHYNRHSDDLVRSPALYLIIVMMGMDLTCIGMAGQMLFEALS